jgi:hypothetical protein
MEYGIFRMGIAVSLLRSVWHENGPELLVRAGTAIQHHTLKVENSIAIG